MGKFSKRQLVALDFDETILTVDSFAPLALLLPKGGEVPKPKNPDVEGWIGYSNEVLRRLTAAGFTNKQMLGAVRNVPAVPGMVPFLRFLLTLKRKKVDVIIVSDANDLFVNDWLVNHDFVECFDGVFANPAYEKPVGGIVIRPYHCNKRCPFSPPNYCKRRILEEFMSTQQEDGILYKRVIYIADGGHDFCPVLTLNKNDIICVRRNFPLDYEIGKHYYKKRKLWPCLIRWDYGQDLLAKIKPLFTSEEFCDYEQIIADLNDKDNARTKKSAVKPCDTDY